MLTIFLFILFNYGVCNILIYGSIFESLRTFASKYNSWFLGKLLDCMICLPFWTGIVSSYILSTLGYANLTPFGYLGVKELWLFLFMNAVFTSGCVWLIHTLQEKLEK